MCIILDEIASHTNNSNTYVSLDDYLNNNYNQSDYSVDTKNKNKKNNKNKKVNSKRTIEDFSFTIVLK